MAEPLTGALVSAAWLAEHLSDGDIRILDCTWHHPSTNLDGRNQYRGRHLPGSVHFDVDHIADPNSDLPHMLPDAADFAKKVGLLGIGDDDRVIVYDRLFGGSAAARVWWMFRVFGHDNVAMLDGDMARLRAVLPGLHEIALGGTAVGTGLNAHPAFAERSAARIAELTGLAFVSAPNKFAGLAGQDRRSSRSAADRRPEEAAAPPAPDHRLRWSRQMPWDRRV